jgi:hypothetical protein
MRPERRHPDQYQDDMSWQHKSKNSKQQEPSKSSSVLGIRPLINVVEPSAPQHSVEQAKRIRERIEEKQNCVNRGNQRKPEWCKRRTCEYPLLGY